MKFGKILTSSENIRRKSDYEDFFIASKKQAEDQLKYAREFVNK